VLNERARSIRIPAKPGSSLVAEYLIVAGKFEDVVLVPRKQAGHVGGSYGVHRDVLDMSLPRSIATYDKSGYKLFIGRLKKYLFGSSKLRITRNRAEAFFDNPHNFGL
jgi:hypothetical protein